ncbi:phage holin family protein [Pseudolysinimonas kribbensis]|jgi:putative membrane protein|uniref:phage holin family protein n=1 Tax=Pseudolysinimonas kribbensis TaxID=433641 RepID=UPI0031D3A31A
MGRLLLRLLISALALWLTTLIMSPHVSIKSYDADPGNVFAYIVTLVLVALIFGIVNGVIGGIIRVVAFPLYVLTLGLISLVVNGLLLLLVAWISSLLGFGLAVESFWWGVLGAIIIGVISWLIGIIVRPFTRSVERR